MERVYCAVRIGSLNISQVNLALDKNNRMDSIYSRASWERQVKVEEDLKRMRITGWRVRAEDRKEWSKTVEQTKTHPGL
jgi:hypothetical protein